MTQIAVAVVDRINLLPQSHAALHNLSTAPVIFPDSPPSDGDDLVNRAGNAEAILASPWTHIDSSFFSRCPSVKYLGICGTSLSRVDIASAQAHGVAVTNVVDYGDEPAAEFTFMRLIQLARGTGLNQWKDFPCELMGKSLGIIGLGALGKSVAKLALAFGMTVSYVSPSRKPEWENRGVTYAPLPQLLAHADIIVITSPTDVRVLDAAHFSQIKANSVLVQLSVGNVLDGSACAEWIAEGNYALFDAATGEATRQALSVLPWAEFSNLISGNTHETLQRLGDKVVANLADYVRSR